MNRNSSVRDLESDGSSDGAGERRQSSPKAALRRAAIFMVLPERTLPAVICACVLVGALVAVVSTSNYGGLTSAVSGSSSSAASSSRPLLTAARSLATARRGSSSHSQLSQAGGGEDRPPLSASGNGTLYSSHGLHILPSFALPQQVRLAEGGQPLLLQPTPFNPPIHDFVDYKADTEFGISPNASKSKGSLASKLGGLLSGGGGSYAPKYGPLTRDDLLLALPSQVDRMALVEATRSWRQGVRTYIAFEQPVHSEMPIAETVRDGIENHNETYGDFRDLINIDPLRNKAGDVRASLTPFMANNTLGADSYKWILYGDDDTVFFIDNALSLLEHLDPDLPYFISDHIWFPQRRVAGDWYVNIHPNRRAPRCLPCGYDDPLMDQHPGSTWFNAPVACPCTHQSVCQSDTFNLMDKTCRFKHNPVGSWNFIHGGAGAIISAGLMRRLPYQDVENAMVSRHWFASGDSMISEIMSDQFDVLPTDPGYGYFRPHIRLFDPGWRGPQVRGPEDENTADFGNDPIGIIDRLETALQGWCNDECEDQLQHTLTTHLRSRYAQADVKMDDVRGAIMDYTGPSHHEAAVYLHRRLAELIQEYSDKHAGRAWFGQYSFQKRSEQHR